MKNLLIRSTTGLLFLAIMIGGILINSITFLILQSAVLVLAMLEFYRIMWGRDNHLYQQLSGICAGLSFILVFSGAAPFYILFPWIIFMLILQLYQKGPDSFNIVGQNILAILYIALPVALWTYFVPGYPSQFNGATLLACLIILWSTDVGAYVFGSLFGRHGKHKLFPSISPNKSWEGFAGGLVSATAAGIIMYYTLLPETYPMYHCVALSLVIGVFGVWGDLVESQLKRSLKIKDSGKIIPGHGGMLDRFDAALFALPMALLYLKIFGLL